MADGGLTYETFVWTKGALPGRVTIAFQYWLWPEILMGVVYALVELGCVVCW